MCTLCENKQKNPGRWCYDASDISEICSNKTFKRHVNMRGGHSLKGTEKQELISLFLNKAKKSVASSMKRKFEKPKGNIYGVAWQHNVKFPTNNLTAPSDSCDSGPACLALMAGSALTTCVTCSSQTWLHAGTTWGALKHTDAWNSPPRRLFHWAGCGLDMEEF